MFACPQIINLEILCMLEFILGVLHLENQKCIDNFRTDLYAKVCFVSIGFPWIMFIYAHVPVFLCTVQDLVDRILLVLSDEEGNLLKSIIIPSIVLLSSCYSLLLVCSIIFMIKFTRLFSITSLEYCSWWPSLFVLAPNCTWFLRSSVSYVNVTFCAVYPARGSAKKNIIGKNGAVKIIDDAYRWKI